MPDIRCRSSNNDLMPDSYLREQSFMLQCSYATDAWLRGGCCGSSRASGGQAAGLHHLFGAGVSGMTGMGWKAPVRMLGIGHELHNDHSWQRA